MRHDPKVTCDLCQNEIDTDLPYSSIKVPIPTAVRQEIMDDAMKLAPHKVLGSIIQMQIPSHYSLEVCNGCIDGLFPTIKSLVATQIREIIAKRKKAQVARPTPDDDDE